MLFSIIIPVFNLENYIVETVESVLNYNVCDFEIIIINDGSTDRTELVIGNLERENAKIKTFYQKNQGQSAARNLGIQKSKGRWILFLDGDDLYVPRLLDFLESELSHKNDIDMLAFTARCFGFAKIEYNDCDKYYQRSNIKDGYYNGREFYDASSLYGKFVASPCLFVVKRELLIENSIFFKKGIYYEDELFTRILLSNVNRLFFLKKPMYLRRIREGSIMQSSLNVKKINSYFVISKELENTRDYNDESVFFYKKGIKFFLEFNKTQLKTLFLIFIDNKFLELSNSMRVKLFKKMMSLLIFRVN